MPQRKPIRNHVCRIAICAVLGAAMTVAAAWLVAVTVRPSATAWSRPSGIGDVWSYWVWKNFGSIKITRRRAWFEMVEPLREEYMATRRREVPAWSVVHQPPATLAAHQSGMNACTEHAFGWPMHALMSESVESFNPVGQGWQKVYAGIVVRPGGKGPDLVVLPLRPIWSGFLFNTVFYAALAFAILYVPGTIRRSVRRRKGRCKACGYDLRGSGGACPECGWAREGGVVAAR